MREIVKLLVLCTVALSCFALASEGVNECYATEYDVHDAEYILENTEKELKSLKKIEFQPLITDRKLKNTKSQFYKIKDRTIISFEEIIKSAKLIKENKCSNTTKEWSKTLYSLSAAMEGVGVLEYLGVIESCHSCWLELVSNVALNAIERKENGTDKIHVY